MLDSEGKKKLIEQTRAERRRWNKGLDPNSEDAVEQEEPDRQKIASRKVNKTLAENSLLKFWKHLTKQTDGEGKHPPGSVKMDIQAVRSLLLDKGIVYFSAMIPLGLFISLLRAVKYGWHSVYFLHIVVAGLGIFITLMRKRLPYRVRAYLLLGLFLFLGAVGLPVFGLVGGGFLVLSIFAVMTALALGTRAGLIACVIDLGIVVATGAAVATGSIPFAFDISEYATSAAGWAVISIVFVLFVPATVLALGALTESLSVSLQDLRNSERRYETVVENAGEGIVVTQDTIIRFLNPCLADIMGCSVEEATSLPFIEFIHPDDRDLVMDIHLRRFRDEQVPSVYELRVVDKNGNTKWLENNGILIEWNGKPAALNFMRDVTARREAENALRKSEEKYRELYENAPLGYQSLDSRGNFLDVNKEWLNILGYSKEEVIGRCFAEFVAPEFIEKFLDNFPRFKESGKIRGKEFDVVTKDGRRLTVAFNGNIEYDQDGQFRRTHCIMLDITEQKKAELALQESEEKYRQLFETETDAILIFDAETLNFIDVNNAAIRMYGYSRKEFLSLTPLAISVEPEASETSIKHVCEGFPVRIPIRRHKKKDGTVFFAEISSSSYMLRGRKVIFGAVRDITSRIQTEQTLRNSEAKFRSYVENAPDGVLVVDQTGRCLEVNAAICEIIGYSKEELLGKSIPDMLAPESREAGAAHFERVVTEGRASGELAYLRKDGSMGFWAVDAVKLSEDRFLGFIKDVTERRQAEDELEKQRFYLAKAQEMGRIGTWELDIEKNRLVWTEENYRIFGVDVGTELNYEIFLQCVHPDDREYVDRKWKAALNKESYDIEHRLVVDGRIKWVREKAIVQFNKEGSPIRGIGFTQDITDRKQAEDALRRSADLLRESQDVARLGHYVYDVKADKWESSEILDAIFGIGHDFPRNSEGWIQIVHSDQREEMSHYLSTTVLDQCQSFDREYRITRISDRQDRWVQGLGRLELNEEGKPIRMVGTIQDVTERKMTQEALRQSEEKYRRVVEDQTEFIVRWLPGGIRTFVNDCYCEYFGITRDEAIGSSFFQLIEENAREQVVGRLEALSPENPISTARHRIIRPDGTTGWNLWTDRAIFDEDGNLVEYQSVGRDITERVEAQEALQESEKELDAIFNSSPVAMILMDSDLMIRKANLAAVNFAHRELQDISGLRPGEAFYCVCHSHDPRGCGFGPECKGCVVRATIEDTLRTGRSCDEIEVVVTIERGGISTERSLLVSTTVLEIAGIPHVLATFQDITVRKRTEHELSRQQYYLARAQEIGRIGAWELDVKQNKLVWTDENYRIFGLPLGTGLTYESFLNCVHPDDRQYVEDKWNAALRKEPYDIEHRIVVEGRIKWVREKADLEFDEQGNCLRGIGFTQEITDRKQAEEELERESFMRKTLLDNLPCIAMILRKSTREIITCNEVARSIGAVQGRTCYGTCAERNDPCPFCLAPEVWQTNEPKRLEVEYRGKHFDAVWLPLTEDTYVHYIFDISDRKEAERKILENREQLKSLASQLSRMEERERHRLATALHDQIGQSLVFSKLKLDELRVSGLSGELLDALKEVCESLDQVIQETKTLTFDLSSPILYELGFEAAVAEWLADEIEEKHGIKTEFCDDGQEKPLDDDIRALLFRNVRELLINIVKHAHAQKVKVAVYRDGTDICVCVEDDGIGFDPAMVKAVAAKCDRFGLFSIRERLEQLGGRIEIDSGPNQGSRVLMKAPLKCETLTDRIEL